MSKSFRLLAAAVLTALSASAHADFVASSQSVNFTFHTVDSDTFTLRIQNADNATGNWGPADYLSYLGFDALTGAQEHVTGALVTVNPAQNPVTSWSFTAAQLTGQGCGNSGNSGAICLDANPNVLLSSDLLFTVDLQGSNIDLSDIVAPKLKVGFTSQTGNKPIGDLLSVDMTLSTTGGGGGGGGGAGGGSTNLPEPASLALAGLALAGAALARRRHRG